MQDRLQIGGIHRAGRDGRAREEGRPAVVDPLRLAGGGQPGADLAIRGRENGQTALHGDRAEDAAGNGPAPLDPPGGEVDGDDLAFGFLDPLRVEADAAARHQDEVAGEGRPGPGVDRQGRFPHDAAVGGLEAQEAALADLLVVDVGGGGQHAIAPDRDRGIHMPLLLPPLPEELGGGLRQVVLAGGNGKLRVGLPVPFVPGNELRPAPFQEGLYCRKVQLLPVQGHSPEVHAENARVPAADIHPAFVDGRGAFDMDELARDRELPDAPAGVGLEAVQQRVVGLVHAVSEDDQPPGRCRGAHGGAFHVRGGLGPEHALGGAGLAGETMEDAGVEGSQPRNVDRVGAGDRRGHKMPLRLVRPQDLRRPRAGLAVEAARAPGVAPVRRPVPGRRRPRQGQRDRGPERPSGPGGRGGAGASGPSHSDRRFRRHGGGLPATRSFSASRAGLPSRAADSCPSLLNTTSGTPSALMSTTAMPTVLKMR